MAPEERVGDRDIAPAVTAAAGLVLPDGTRWTVVIGADGQPAAAISPAGASVATNLFIADAETPTAAVIGSAGQADHAADTVVVVTRGAVPIGVWSGDDFVDALLYGRTRGGLYGALQGDIQLPGRISKQDITRHCRYGENGRACTVILVVPEKPDPMPSCPAQAGITAHTFEW
jgi:hypothetical protein